MTSRRGYAANLQSNYALCAEKEGKSTSASRKPATETNKAASVSKAPKKQTSKTAQSPKFDPEMAEVPATESFKDMMKQLISNTNIDPPRDSRFAKSNYDKRREAVLSSIDELREVSRTIGSDSYDPTIEPANSLDQRQSLRASLEQMMNAEGMRERELNPEYEDNQDRAEQIVQRTRQLTQNIANVEDSVEMDFNNYDTRSGSAVRAGSGALSGDDMKDLLRIFSQTESISPEDSSAALLREVEEQTSSDSARVGYEGDVSPAGRLSPGMSMVEKIEERNKQQKLKMFAAFDEELPGYEGLLCPQCNSPCDEDEMNDFGKCTFCRQIDLRDPSVHKLQHYDNTFSRFSPSSNTNSNTNANINTQNTRKIDSVSDVAQRQQLEQQRKEQQERLFSNSYSSSFPTAGNESKVSPTLNKSSQSTQSAKMIPQSNAPEGRSINSMSGSSGFESMSNGNNGNDRNSKVGTQIEQDDPRQQQQQQKTKNYNIGKKISQQNDDDIKSNKSSQYSGRIPSYYAENVRATDGSEIVSERFEVLERQYEEMSEILDSEVLDRIHVLENNLDKVIGVSVNLYLISYIYFIILQFILFILQN